MKNNQGFTLLEVGIVIVIIGLIVGAITVGQEMVRGTELKNFMTELNQFNVAVNGFEDKYNRLPGDSDTATRYWGIAGGAGSDATCYGTASVNTTCNGDNNGEVAAGTESFRFWQHLQLAGFITGEFNGTTGAGSANHAVPGTNSPDSKVTGGAWSMAFDATKSGDANYYDGAYGNVFYFGSGTSNNVTRGIALSPTEAFNLDDKIDDGLPAYGKVLTYKPALLANCSTSATAASAEYKFDEQDNRTCALIVVSDF